MPTQNLKWGRRFLCSRDFNFFSGSCSTKFENVVIRKPALWQDGGHQAYCAYLRSLLFLFRWWLPTANNLTHALPIDNKSSLFFFSHMLDITSNSKTIQSNLVFRKNVVWLRCLDAVGTQTLLEEQLGWAVILILTHRSWCDTNEQWTNNNRTWRRSIWRSVTVTFSTATINMRFSWS